MKRQECQAEAAGQRSSFPEILPFVQQALPARGRETAFRYDPSLSVPSRPEVFTSSLEEAFERVQLTSLCKAPGYASVSTLLLRLVHSPTTVIPKSPSMEVQYEGTIGIPRGLSLPLRFGM